MVMKSQMTRILPVHWKGFWITMDMLWLTKRAVIGFGERERTTTRVKLRSRSILIIISEKCLDFRVEYVNSQLWISNQFRWKLFCNWVFVIRLTYMNRYVMMKIQTSAISLKKHMILLIMSSKLGERFWSIALKGEVEAQQSFWLTWCSESKYTTAWLNSTLCGVCIYWIFHAIILWLWKWYLPVDVFHLLWVSSPYGR